MQRAKLIWEERGKISSTDMRSSSEAEVTVTAWCVGHKERLAQPMAEERAQETGPAYRTTGLAQVRGGKDGLTN